MQSVSSSAPTPEAILEWLQKEMGYRSKSHVPSVDAIRKICRGNMIPIWSFLMNRAKSEKTVESIRRNITVHGGSSSSSDASVAHSVNPVKEESKGKGRRKEKAVAGESLSSAESREAALHERELAAKEVERLRNVVRRQRKDLKARMLEVSREEAERKRMLDERANYRHKQATLEAYDQQCDEAARIFAEYHKRLQVYVNQARDAHRWSLDSSSDLSSKLSTNSEREAVYSSVKGSKSADDVILVETTRERSIRKACESLASHMVDRICNSFPAYEGNGIHSNPELETTKLSFEYDGEISDEVRAVILNCLSSPPLLLQVIAAHTLRLKTRISREIEKVDVRADAETLRYKYENNQVSSPLSCQFNGNGKITTDTHSKGSNNQLLERQKAYVQQFLGTEDALNKAAEARVLCQKLKNRLHGSANTVSSHSVVGGTSQNVRNLRQFELDVWGEEREAAGLRASLKTLISEIHRLNKLCAERKEAEHSLKQKWKKIEEFDARRSELETIYTTLLKANMDAAAFWNQQPLAATEHAMATIIPAAEIVADISKNAKDLIEKEVSAFFQSPDNSLYMLPATPQALLESMGANGSTGPEAVASAEKNAALLTARAGARDPSAIPSICRISAGLQYPAGLEGSDASLASVLESLEFCLKLRGSEACVLEDLAKAIYLVDIRHDLVGSGRALLSHAYSAQQEYEMTTKHCLNLATEQENAITEKWLPELKTAVMNAQTSLEHCKHVRGLLDEWYEQPAATIVDWVTVDGQNVAAWHNHVKTSHCLLR